MKRMLLLLLSTLLLAGCDAGVPRPDSSVDTTTAAATTTADSSKATVTDPTTADQTTADPTTAAAVPTATATSAVTAAGITATTDWRRNYTSRQIIKDNTFCNGFTIMGRDHS